ncbi:tryptophan--tRNA ligase [Exophiala dermatitidis]|uniref:Tryptophan--tRNA ligase, cytoplasmic n=2 Tax=Exophiala dermatitidis TaxID=5970 RepID=H6C2J3_EXODN|nr:tryptophanyl-tRNA synthetase [Exophiala dermatitidis NIH/UT8656]KAJ4508553.1 tryptophan--tRNA ligase [Exophiala dermatitidis]EHY58771.1 tryptophanyl-tRNA synthetase [Exophiala dermatitidis NIH/UT8656]KAJ4510471.1 tryptophan--tRNA ligase [Exophiala dermatitidis]KAJ4510595.1 tryptophan--tRNA ligase [Exophiala dermatitidis]KAJ4535083.1 tryptophan--tRNA ligase [Exophiala dermatitidis]
MASQPEPTGPPPADEPGQPPKLTTSALADQAHHPSVGQRVTPFEVSGGVDESGKLLPVDYEKLTREFGATPITPQLLERFERVTGKRAHRFMRRGIVFSHRELEKILDRYEKGEPFYLYTGRGPSSDSMHVGHSVPFEFTKYLQDVFDCPLVIQLTDDEKFMHSQKITIDDAKRFAKENAKDIIAIGFDPAKTFIFSDFFYMGRAFYENVCAMAKRITINQIKGTFGFNDSNNIGEFHFCAIQSAPAFATSFPHIFGDNPSKVRQIPCLIPCAIDQDPYFRQCRDNAEKMKFKKPSLIHSIFLPALQGPGSKMSASIDSSAIFLTDTPNQIKNKINRYAFSGGQDTAEKQRELGGNTKVDVPFQYLTFFMEDDDELARIKKAYESGEMMTGEIKQICIKYLQEYVAGFQTRRKAVTEETREEFFKLRPLVYQGNPIPIKVEKKEATSTKKNEAKKDKAPAEAGGHSKKLSVGGAKVEIQHDVEQSPNGELKEHVKRLSLTKEE